MTLRTDLITWLPQDTLAVRTLRIGYLCGLRLTKAVGFYVVILLCYCSVILSNAKVLEYRFFTVFCTTLLKRFFTSFCALLLKRFFTAFRMTKRCAKHRYARAEWQDRKIMVQYYRRRFFKLIQATLGCVPAQGNTLTRVITLPAAFTETVRLLRLRKLCGLRFTRKASPWRRSSA